MDNCCGSTTLRLYPYKECETAMDTPEAFVQCIACHDNGEWMDLTTDDVPDRCERCGGEEFRVYDHEGYGYFLADGECSPEEASLAARIIDAIRADDIDPDAVGAWMDNIGLTITEWDAPTRDDFQDAFAGEWNSLTDYAYEYADNFIFDAGTSQILRQYFDFDSFGRDLVLGGDIFTVDRADGSILIFRSM